MDQPGDRRDGAKIALSPEPRAWPSLWFWFACPKTNTRKYIIFSYRDSEFWYKKIREHQEVSQGGTDKNTGKRMRLLDQERRVLAAVELDAFKSMAEVRRETKFRDHTIRYHLDRMQRRGVIELKPFINIYPLGFQDYAFYFSLAGEKEAAKRNLIQDLKASTHVSWLASMGGDYQYGVSVCAKHHQEVIRFLDALSSRYPGAFFQKALSLRVSLSLFPRKYLGNIKAGQKPISFGGEPTRLDLDDKDLAILAALEHSRFESFREIGRALGMPATTLQHRLSRLEQSGVIAGYVYRVDPAAIDMQHFRLLLYVRGVSAKLRERLYSYSAAHPHVTYYIECLGSWDYELGVEVEKAEQMTAVAEQIYQNFGAELAALKILPLFQHYKIENFPFKPEDLKDTLRSPAARSLW
jgi:DNA-binding Lrp family transcriptional regulator